MRHVPETSRISKPPFEHIYYDESTICWGHGNNLVGPNLIAKIQLSEPSKKEDRRLKKDYDVARSIYEDKINKGQKFHAGGEGANAKLICKITSITVTDQKQYLTWKQIDCPAEYKPASGKWGINAFISMVKSKRIITIE